MGLSCKDCCHAEYPWLLLTVQSTTNMENRQWAQLTGKYVRLTSASRKKHYENHTPMELLRHLRMEHAATLLMSTTQTIDMIAQQVGYRTPYAFSDAFQRHTGK